MAAVSGTGQLPTPPSTEGRLRRPISRAQIEVVASRSAGAFGALMAVQSLGPMIGQSAQTDGWSDLTAGILFAEILAVLIAAVLRTAVRTTASVFAISYLVALPLWPLMLRDPDAVLQDRPWLWWLCTVATGCAVIAFPTWLAAAYTVLTPVAFGILRLTPSGGGASPLLAALDTVYAIVLGGVLLILVSMLRHASSAVDAAQSTALESYAAAVRQHALEAERVEVDAIVHDSVLTTLLSAASARTAEGKALGSRMAADAIGHLQAAGATGAADTGDERIEHLGERISVSARELSAFEVVVGTLPRGSLPVAVGEALYSAAVQAMMNSLQHAGAMAGIVRTVAVNGRGTRGIRIVVSDDGAGFDPAAVPDERLGLRVSIHERVTAAGGCVALDTAPGKGTRIEIVWPAETSLPETEEPA